jgi:hypothetical protein
MEPPKNAIVNAHVGKYSSEDIHRALFAKLPKRRTLAELKRGIAQYVRDKHRR